MPLSLRLTIGFPLIYLSFGLLIGYLSVLMPEIFNLPTDNQPSSQRKRFLKSLLTWPLLVFACAKNARTQNTSPINTITISAPIIQSVMENEAKDAFKLPNVIAAGVAWRNDKLHFVVTTNVPERKEQLLQELPPSAQGLPIWNNTMKTQNCHQIADSIQIIRQLVDEHKRYQEALTIIAGIRYHTLRTTAHAIAESALNNLPLPPGAGVDSDKQSTNKLKPKRYSQTRWPRPKDG